MEGLRHGLVDKGPKKRHKLANRLDAISYSAILVVTSRSARLSLRRLVFL